MWILIPMVLIVATILTSQGRPGRPSWIAVGWALYLVALAFRYLPSPF